MNKKNVLSVKNLNKIYNDNSIPSPTKKISKNRNIIYKNNNDKKKNTKTTDKKNVDNDNYLFL